ncbi:uncharacterized protein LOC131860052 [Cryptomeria japonica]|uniref:uncharacterized protein LOC131860052 n=1 Tax=Cryptomeria japonica TaxID=3369 RepID=UPI0027DA1C02|nr:uncharacterized protein LOC131860052 [Cryptomeria japonica]
MAERQGEQRAGNSKFKPGNGGFLGDDNLSVVGAGNQTGFQASQGTEGDKETIKSVEEKDSKNGDPHDRESIKEVEQRIDVSAQKSESKIQKEGPNLQERVDMNSNDDAFASSNSKENGGDFNEAQDYNISDFEPILLLTNGSPKSIQCNSPPNSLETVVLEGNLRIVNSKEGKPNNGGPNGEDKETQMEMENVFGDIEKDSSEIETEESRGEESWKEEDVGEEEGEAGDASDQDSPTHSVSLVNIDSQPREKEEDKINEEKDTDFE